MADRRQPAESRQEVRCCRCGRLLCKTTRSALRAGGDVEIKCKDCNTLNYLVGDDETAETVQT